MPKLVSQRRPKPEAEFRFRSLLDFIDRAMGGNPDELAMDVHKFVVTSTAWRQDQDHTPRPAVDLIAGTPTLKALWGRDPLETIKDFCLEVLKPGLAALRDGGAFLRHRPVPDGIVWSTGQSRIHRIIENRRGETYAPDPVPGEQYFLSIVFDLLTEVAPWLRTCAACKKLFLYRRPKQIYCGASCAQRVRMVRFLAKRHRKPARPHPVSERRKRQAG